MRENKLKKHPTQIWYQMNPQLSMATMMRNEITLFSVSKMHSFSSVVISKQQFIELNWADLGILFPQCKLNLEYP